MPSRILLPNRSADVRWGYLDKFERNPLLARSFAATSLAAVASLLLLRQWPPSPIASPIVPPKIVTVAFIDVPSIVVTPSIAPVRRKPAIHVEPVAKIVPSQTAPDEPLEGPSSDRAAELGSTDPAAMPGLDVEGVLPGPPTAGAPDADDFIPVEQQPVLVTMPRPSYPDLAREAHIEGTVLVRVLVGEDGFVRQCRVVQSVLGLDEVAVAAARAAVFRPALQQQRPVAVWVVVPIEFRLQD